jgi:hypothetical protein
MGHDLDKEESAKLMAVATDMRPDENFHHDPALGPAPLAAGDDLTEAESAAILTIAADVRPFENFHPGREQREDD